MSRKATNKRQARKLVNDYFVSRCAPEQFDVRREMRLLQGGSRLRGVLAALAIYLGGFAASYAAWSGDHITYELFYKMTWIVLLPATVVGVLAWQLRFNRGESAVFRRLANAMRQVEGEDGFLWRFGPLLQAGRPEDYDSKTVINQSRAGQLDAVEPEDYARAIVNVHSLLNDGQSTAQWQRGLADVEANISGSGPPT